ncbi:MAG: T9SS type A sorting domain-containing protein [Flavobacteriia bacterium]|jgi:hypothetical protein
MKGTLLFVLSALIPSFLFSQGEGIGPLTTNPELLGKYPSGVKGNRANAGTFDSTFIYFSDTLNLPFFDEFSKDHFQVYNADFADPGVTSDKKYRILENSTLLPIPNDQLFTGQITFRRTYDIGTSTFIDNNFLPIQYKVGDLTSYPVNYATTDLYPPYYIYDTIGVSDESDTVWIIDPEFYQDSATQFFTNLNDPNAFWLDRHAYHNYRYAFEPRSIGVVTFDGLNENGYPYNIGTTLTNYADYLTSKPLDLSALNAADSVYFSFLYQTEGFGDIPEAGDSLVLEFYAKDLDVWTRIWSASGEGTTDFKVGHVRLEDPEYFKKGFQFRFKNYGALSGSLDHFHLDYVHLRALSGFQDTLFKDFAFVYPAGSLLKTYTAVPWDHFKNSPTGKMTENATITVHNGSNLPENNQNGKIEVLYNSVIEGSYIMNATTLSGGNINYDPQTTYTSEHDCSAGYIFDITKPGTSQNFNLIATASAQFPNLAQNDSTFGIQHFGNYYSYDDGSAEAAYGPAGVQARLAVKYDSYEEDSLIGMKIHFVPSVNDVSDKLFLLTVWAAGSNGMPSTVLYEDDVFFPRSPIYGNYRNNFIDYYFLDTLKVKVGTSFFVGWRQFDEDRLNVGLDRNLDNHTATYYSIDGGSNWIQSSISGSVMIRPMFSTELDAELGVDEKSKYIDAILYPNPTTDEITIEMSEGKFEGVDIYSIQGVKIISSDSKVVSLSQYPEGVYFFRIKGSQKVYKIIKQ